MNEQEMQQMIKDKVREYMLKFYPAYEGKTSCMIAYPDILFEDIGQLAGECGYGFEEKDGQKYTYGFIKFNKNMIPLNFERYIDSIVGHEVAHWCVAILYGNTKDDDNTNHKGVWKEMMKFFGCKAVEYLNPIICPPIDNMYLYECACSTINFCDDQHKEALEYGCYCEHCNTDYKFIKRNPPKSILSKLINLFK